MFFPLPTIDALVSFARKHPIPWSPFLPTAESPFSSTSWMPLTRKPSTLPATLFRWSWTPSRMLPSWRSAKRWGRIPEKCWLPTGNGLTSKKPIGGSRLKVINPFSSIFNAMIIRVYLSSYLNRFLSIIIFLQTAKRSPASSMSSSTTLRLVRCRGARGMPSSSSSWKTANTTNWAGRIKCSKLMDTPD